MANIHLRGLDESTALRLKDEARRRGLSVNAFVLQLIRQGIGKRPTGPRRPIHHDLDELAGTWCPEEAATFLEALFDFEQVDDEVWR